MSLITRGYGKGNIITKGLGLRKRIVKKIVQIISRVIPVKRTPFKIEIRVLGDLVVPFRKEVEVTGKRDLSEILWLLLEEEEE